MCFAAQYTPWSPEFKMKAITPTGLYKYVDGMTHNNILSCTVVKFISLSWITNIQNLTNGERYSYLGKMLKICQWGLNR